jgi:hypothetical protein
VQSAEVKRRSEVPPVHFEIFAIKILDSLWIKGERERERRWIRETLKGRETSGTDLIVHDTIGGLVVVVIIMLIALFSRGCRERGERMREQRQRQGGQESVRPELFPP